MNDNGWTYSAGNGYEPEMVFPGICRSKNLIDHYGGLRFSHAVSDDQSGPEKEKNQDNRGGNE